MDAPELEGYIVDRLIGRGGMAEVYRANQVLRNLPVAIKFLTLPDPETNPVAQHFLRVARVISRLGHPGIVRVYDFGTSLDGTPYIVTELLQGQTLRRRMRDGPISLELAVEIAGRTLDALGYLHSQGLVHRDIKPENIFLNEDGHIRLLDLDLLDLEGELQLPEIAKWFTREYASPEQIRRQETDARSDLYSLGIILYEMLTGSPPFRSDEAKEVIRLQLSAEPPPLPEPAPKHVNITVARALRKPVEDRYQSADEMMAALDWTGPSDIAFAFAIPIAPVAQPVVVERARFGTAIRARIGGVRHAFARAARSIRVRPRRAQSPVATVERVAEPVLAMPLPIVSEPSSAFPVAAQEFVESSDAPETTMPHDGYSTGVVPESPATADVAPSAPSTSESAAPEVSAPVRSSLPVRAGRQLSSVFTSMLKRAGEPGGREADMVHFSVTHPRLLAPGNLYALGVWVHLPDDRDAVAQLAEEGNDAGEIVIKSKGVVPLERGSTVTVRLHIPDLVTNDSEDYAVWNGEPTNTTFVFSVPHDGPVGGRPGLATFHLGDDQIAKFHFVLPVRSGATTDVKEVS